MNPPDPPLEANEILSPFEILMVVLGDAELAIKCLEALGAYAGMFKIGNNQASAMIFLEDEVVFGAVDLWNGDEEVM